MYDAVPVIRAADFRESINNDIREEIRVGQRTRISNTCQCLCQLLNTTVNTYIHEVIECAIKL